MSLSARSSSAGVSSKDKAREHRRPNARAAQYIERGAALLERLEDTDVSRAESAAATRHEAHRLSGQKAIKPL